jgi:hypothetical protein
MQGDVVAAPKGPLAKSKKVFPGWVKFRLRIRDPDPGSGSGMNNSDHISECVETFFWGENT